MPEMQCPKCMEYNTEIIPAPVEHYICNNPNCDPMTMGATQFQQVIDEKICFPYNQMFVNRSLESFYRKPYLEVKAVGLNVTQ